MQSSPLRLTGKTDGYRSTRDAAKKTCAPRREISEEAAMNLGAAFCSDGRRVNNLLAYQGIFKGAMDAQATRINDSMLLAVADALVNETHAGETIPDPLDLHIHTAVARATAYAAITSGVARRTLDDDYFIDYRS